MSHCTTNKKSQKTWRDEYISYRCKEIIEQLEMLIPNLKSSFPNESDSKLLDIGLKILQIDATRYYAGEY
jgi:hypothetical protein